MKPKTTPAAPAFSLRVSDPRIRMAFMVILLLALIGMLVQVMSSDSSRQPTDNAPVTETVRVEVPIVDRDLLVREVEDSTPLQRLRSEAKPREHLLMMAQRLGSATLRAMGLADTSSTVAAIEQRPVEWRGRPVSFRGTLESVRPYPEPHPSGSGQVISGRLRTEEGRDVLFEVVEPIGKDVKLGEWVRIEGLFFKMRDENIPEQVSNAPLVIGRRLLPSWRIWAPVTELDQELLRDARDASLADRLGLPQLLPLYHLASFAQNLPPDSKLLRNAPDIRDENWHELVANPGAHRGAPYTLTGAVAKIRVVPAEENPLSITEWSEVWMWSSAVKAVICVWVPGRVADFRQNDAAIAKGLFLKLFSYETRDPDSPMNTTCLFVAPDVVSLIVEKNPFTSYMGYALMALAVSVAGLFFVAMRREKLRSLLALDRRIDRRRKLRERAAATGSDT